MKKTSKTGPSQQHKAIFPHPIAKGDTIGLIAPAGPLVSKRKFAAGVKLLEEKGYSVKFNQRLLNTKGYLAGSDQERADDFNSMWTDPEVKALVAARGGYGCLRIIDKVDMKLIRKNPKMLVGFSDLTVLLNAINKKTKLVTFHGPVVTTLASIDRQSQKSFFDLLMGTFPDLIKPKKIEILQGGKSKAKGVLLGGNLTTLVHMIGTPYEILWDKTILFIEDIGETPYRLDRLLTHLDKAKRIQKIKGLILGSFTDDERKERKAMQKAVMKKIAELFNDLDIPVWANFPSGHGRSNLTLPIGMEVEMDSSSGILLLNNK